MRFIFTAWVVCVGVTAFAAGPLTESTFTEIIRQADVVAAAGQAVTPARTNEVFRVPDMVRTGPDSRLEMTAPDQTVTRVGANAVFTFDAGERSIRLFKGSILFHPPAGAGGGTVRHGGTAASVLGTTMICAVLSDGGFKVMVLEGEATVTLANGAPIDLKAGQMMIVPPDGDHFGPVVEVNLGQLVYHLLLVAGFSQPLSSMPLIAGAIRLQDAQIAAGTLNDFANLRFALYGLDVIGIDLNFPPWLLNTLDHTMVFVSPVH
jgi:hypothetical protein